MAQTRTTQGLTASVHLLQGEYPTGQKAPKGYKKNIRILFDEDLPAWNVPCRADETGKLINYVSLAATQ